jgi:hypothetical protein
MKSDKKTAVSKFKRFFSASSNLLLAPINRRSVAYPHGNAKPTAVDQRRIAMLIYCEVDAAREKAERLRVEFISAILAKSFAAMGRKVKIATRELRSLYALRGGRHA